MSTSANPRSKTRRRIVLSVVCAFVLALGYAAWATYEFQHFGIRDMCARWQLIVVNRLAGYFTEDLICAVSWG